MDKRLIAFYPDYTKGIMYNHKRNMWPLGIKLSVDEIKKLKDVLCVGGMVSTDEYLIQVDTNCIDIKNKFGYSLFKSVYYIIKDITSRK